MKKWYIIGLVLVVLTIVSNRVVDFVVGGFIDGNIASWNIQYVDILAQVFYWITMGYAIGLLSILIFRDNKRSKV